MKTQLNPIAVDAIELLHKENELLYNCIKYLTFSSHLSPDTISAVKIKLEEIIKNDKARKKTNQT